MASDFFSISSHGELQEGTGTASPTGATDVLVLPTHTGLGRNFCLICGSCGGDLGQKRSETRDEGEVPQSEFISSGKGKDERDPARTSALWVSGDCSILLHIPHPKLQ